MALQLMSAPRSRPLSEEPDAPHGDGCRIRRSADNSRALILDLNVAEGRPVRVLALDQTCTVVSGVSIVMRSCI